MPLIPVTPPPEHPADLVIDAFGTYLGRRSERLLIRYRTSVSPRPAARCVVPPSAPEQPAAGPTDDKETQHHEGSCGTACSKEETTKRAVHGLLRIWCADSCPEREPQPLTPDRLSLQLDPISEHEPGASHEPGWTERLVPLSRLHSVTISGRGVTISSDLIAALIERGISISFISGRGKSLGQVIAPGLSGTVQTRRAQLAAYHTPLGVQLAVEFVRGKLRNQKHQLQYSGKYLKMADAGRFEQLQRKIAALSTVRKRLADFTADDVDQVRDELMGYEGTGARLYWEGIALVLQGRLPFPGRETRGATDPINSALNYGYGILYSQVTAAIANAGLELFAGFLHTDRPGKPALVLDLVEEFRAPVVDRVVVALVNQGVSLDTDGAGLTEAARRMVAERMLDRLATPVPYAGKHWKLSAVIQNQARHLAVAVRGERTYRSFASRW